uniref:Uncharacterized protein n=1 Tax=Spiroplasma citri TaxID=2133 RepID=Q14NI8_SPICI|nr:hypothetical protein SPICI04_149 [Spiroplasma citri]
MKLNLNKKDINKILNDYISIRILRIANKYLNYIENFDNYNINSKIDILLFKYLDESVDISLNLEKINFCNTEKIIKKDLIDMSRNEKRRFKKAILKRNIFANLAIELNFVYNFINKKEIQNEFIKFLSDNYYLLDKEDSIYEEQFNQIEKEINNKYILNINAYFNFFNKNYTYFNT